MSSPVTTPRNRDQWLSIAQFLGAFAIRRYDAERSAEAAPPCGEVAVREAFSQSLPDGNHGENLNEAQA